jgi:hypothetical protein
MLVTITLAYLLKEIWVRVRIKNRDFMFAYWLFKNLNMFESKSRACLLGGALT